MPIRLQRKRTKNFHLPEGTVCVTRGTKWGNPFRIENGISREMAIALFRQSITPEKEAEIRRELRGKDLACFCGIHQRCHADLLLEIANG